MRVLKFGGTSVGSPESIREIAGIIRQKQKGGAKIAMVVSAMKGITNALILAATKAAKGDDSYKEVLKEIETKQLDTSKELLHPRSHGSFLGRQMLLLNELEDVLHGVFILKELTPRTLDLVQSYGERLSALTINEFFNQDGIKSEYVDTRELIITNDNHGKSKVNFRKTRQRLKKHFSNMNGLQVVTGFIASTDEGETSTLGRGGSDYTAAIIGSALEVDEIEIWTDVDGIMTADPGRVKSAFSLESISYEEAMELSYFGAKVIYPPTIQPAISNNIPIRIMNTFNREFPGTLIQKKAGNGQQIKGITSIEDISLISVIGSGMIGVPGVSSRLFTAMAREDINIILITQASSEHSICFAVNPEEGARAKKVITEEFSREIKARKINKVIVEESLSILAVIGEGMRKNPGISGKLFNAMGKNGVNVVAIAQGSSELNISIVIPKKDLSKSLNLIHQVFFLSEFRRLNLFLVGTGLIGNTLVEQIKDHAEFLEKEQSLRVRLAGVANTRKMLLDRTGIDLKSWKSQLDKKGSTSDIKSFVEEMKELNLPNSVFVDCTSSSDIIKGYRDIILSSISIITPNKIANSRSYSDYRDFQDIAFRKGVRFLYETTVGAGLPVISTLKDLRHSGDRILKIEGVLSGTLSYIFNSFTSEKPFSAVVKEAQEKGYTEPDPRDDLDGSDVARKILILAREAGLTIEPEDVTIKPFIPEKLFKKGTVDSFFKQLAGEDNNLKELVEAAASEGKKIKYIASLEEGKAEVGLRSVDSSHPTYHLSGSENIISFTTDRYLDSPLVIRGPGAGAEVTAAGVFAEIISLGNYLLPES